MDSEAGSIAEPLFQEELQRLLAAAKGMAEGHFHRSVTVRARGVIGELAAYMNHTLRNLQNLDPTVKGSSREIPKVARHLTEIIQTTEEATNRVLEEAERLVEEQTAVEQRLSRIQELLRHPNLDAELAATLEEAREVHRRSQGRAMDIMSAMEFQDLTTQKIQKLIALVAEVEGRLLQLLVLFRIEDAGGPEAADPILEKCAQDGAALCDQALVDRLLADFQGHAAERPGEE